VPDDERDSLAGNPDLDAAGAAMREEWRAEEEFYGREAHAQWEHGRRMADVWTELMHRGDTVAIALERVTFTGVIVAVGDDLASLRTPAGRVDVHRALPARNAADRHALLPAPFVLRVVERAKSGGMRQPRPMSFRARLLELESDGGDVVVGCGLIPDELLGRITVGRDQLHVRGRDDTETYVPLAWVSYVRPHRP